MQTFINLNTEDIIEIINLIKTIDIKNYLTCTISLN